MQHVPRSPRVLIAGFLALLLLAPAQHVGQAAAPAPAPIGLAFQASWHGDLQALAGTGNDLYLSQAGALVVYDRTAPNGRQQIGSQDLNGDVVELQVSGDTLLALVQPPSAPGDLKPLTLQLLSLADPAAPQLIGSVAGFEPLGLSVDGNIAYAIGSDGTLVSVTSDALPGSPHVARYPLGVATGHFVARGSYLYVPTSVPDAVVVKVYALTPGSAPNHVTDISAPFATVTHAAPGIQATAVMGNLVMVTVTSAVTQAVYGHVSIDISAPGAPTVTAAGTRARSVVESGNIAYVTKTSSSNVEENELWDVSDRSHPTLIGLLYAPPTTQGQIVGDRYYFAGPTHLSSISLGQTHPTIERHLEQNPLVAWRMQGDRLYTIDRHDYGQMIDMFKAYDVSNPARPTLIASIPDDSAQALAVGDSFAVTAAGGYQRAPRWTVYDVTGPTPTAVYTETPALPITALALDGSTLAMLRSDGVRFYDLTTGPPTLTATAAITGTGIVLAGAVAWVMDSPHGTVRAVDFSTPQAPVISGPLTYAPFAGSAAVARGATLILGTGASLSVAEHHADGSISWLAQLGLPDSVFSVDLAADTAVVGTESRCVLVDLSLPAAPVLQSIGPVRYQPCSAQWAGTDLVVGPYTAGVLANGIEVFRPFALSERIWLPVIGAPGS